MHDAATQAIFLTLRVAAFATVLILPVAILTAYLLARRDFPGKSLLSALLTLPLVLPPTAIGYLLLELLAVDGPLGARSLGFDLGLLLTWRGAVLAAAVMALPLVLRTARVAFEGVDVRLEEVARTLGHGPLRTFLCTTLPLAWPGLVAAAILGFTRAVGEFGATVILAGNIPGRTQTLAAGIYSAQLVGDRRGAWVLIAFAVALGLVSVTLAERLAAWRRGS